MPERRPAARSTVPAAVRAVVRAEAPALATTVVLTVVALVVVLQLWNAWIGIPFLYSGDNLLNLMGARSTALHGWYIATPDLGAPFGQHLADFPAAGDAFHLALLWVLTRFSDNPAAVVNVFFLVSFVAIAVSAHAASRVLGVSRVAAVFVAVLYAFLPGHLIRAQSHLFLSSYFVIPLVIALALREAGDRPWLARRADGRRVHARSVAAAMVLLLAGTCGLYYAVFSGLVLATVGLGVGLARRRWRVTVRLVGAAAVVGAALLAQLLPVLAYQRANGDNLSSVRRNLAELEVFGLKLSGLLLPVPGHRIPSFAALREELVATPVSPYGLEALGVVASVGFVLLAGRLLLGGLGGRVDGDRYGPLAFVAVVSVAVATASGVSLLLGLFGFTQIRVWERMSVVIAFPALVAAGLAFEAVRARLPLRGKARVLVPPVLAVALVAVGVADQTTPAMVPRYADIRAQWLSDETFVGSLGATLPAGTAVFQVPYVPFPEWPGVEAMQSYDPLRPYLHSRGLRWSAGAPRGRAGDWQLRVVDRPAAELLDRIVAAGFRALWIDRFGFADRGAALEAEVAALTGAPAMVSPDNRYVVVDLHAFADQRLAAWGPAGTQARADATTGVVAVFREGFGAVAYGSGSRWSSTSGSATVEVLNTTDRTIPLVVRFQTTLTGVASAQLRVDGRPPVPLGPEPMWFDVPVTAAPGRTAVRLVTSGLGSDGLVTVGGLDAVPLDNPWAAPSG